MSQFKIKYIKDDWRDMAGLMIRQVLPDGQRNRIKFLFTPFDEGEIAEPVLRDEQAIEFMQAVCNAAYEAGIYPKQLKDRSDELTATKYHLEDMRTFAFDLRNIDNATTRKTERVKP